MKCPKCITNLASAIYSQSKNSDGLEAFFANVQKTNIKGVHILRFTSWSESGFVSGENDCCWLLDDTGLTQIPSPGPQEFYDGISSPFPRLSFTKLEDKKYGLNYSAGPRAARGLVAMETFSSGTVRLTVSENDPS